MSNGTVNRNYKDSLFRMIFREKKDLLDLYNAVNGSDYTDPELLEVNTIEDVLYMGMKNDVSFLIGDYLNLYEEQSTLNPNMPLRGLFYFSRLYQGFVARKQLDLYGRIRLPLPMPKYLVFYIGLEDLGETMELRLSDTFLKRDGDVPSLECIATYLNVNYGHNQKLMAGCRKLREYSIVIDQIRRQLATGKELQAAVDTAVQYFIDHGVLDDFLRKHRAEVKEMILTGYADELHWENEKRTSYEAGIKKGSIQTTIKIYRKLNLPEAELQKQLMDEFSLDEDEARQYLFSIESGQNS